MGKLGNQTPSKHVSQHQPKPPTGNESGKELIDLIKDSLQKLFAGIAAENKARTITPPSPHTPSSGGSGSATPPSPNSGQQ